MDKALVYETKDSRFDPGHGLSINDTNVLGKILFRMSQSCHCQAVMGRLCSWAISVEPSPELAVAGQPQLVGKHWLAGPATLQLEQPAELRQLLEPQRLSLQSSV